MIVPLRKFVAQCEPAGATITCGVAYGQGLDRRIDMDDCPGLALAVATLIKFAAGTQERLNATMPACKWFKSTWASSGLLETHTQLRALADKEEAEPIALKVDFCNWRKRKRPTKVLTGPCVFGCTTSAKTAATSRAKERWCRVPKPSPWPGVKSGEVLCLRCYSWGIGNPKAKKRKAQAISIEECRHPAIRVGHQLRIDGLVNRLELNGGLCTVQNLPDDDDRVVVKQGQKTLRLHRDNLITPNAPMVVSVGPSCFAPVGACSDTVSSVQAMGGRDMAGSIVAVARTGADKPPGCNSEQAGEG